MAASDFFRQGLTTGVTQAVTASGSFSAWNSCERTAVSRTSASIVLVVALLALAPAASSQDLFDEADGGSWFASKGVSVNNGLLTSSTISLWRHPALGIAEIRMMLTTDSSGDPLIPNALALKLDGEVTVIDCYETDVDLGLGGVLTSSSLYTYGTCEMDYQVSETILSAKTLEAQVSTVGRRLKPKVLNRAKLAKLQDLREQKRKRD